MESASSKRYLLAALDGFDAEKKTEPSCRISSSSRLCWELDEPEGPHGGGSHSRGKTPGKRLTSTKQRIAMERTAAAIAA